MFMCDITIRNYNLSSVEVAFESNLFYCDFMEKINFTF